MAELDDLQNKILQFKVIDLQSLLRHANSVKYGRKQELQKRAFDILRRNPEIIRDKVLEIYRGGYEKFPRLTSGDAYALQYFPNSSNCSSEKPASMPSLTFMESPFFAVVGCLMEPVVLAPSSRYNNVVEVRYWNFKLTLDHANLLAQSRNKVKVHLKFCVSDMSKRKDTLPYGNSVRVNGQRLVLPQNKSTGEGEQKQQKNFIDITEFIKISPVVTNSIKISWIREPIVYGATIQLVSIKGTKELVTSMAHEKVIPPSVTKAMVLQKLAPDFDGGDEISTTTLKASLICPLSKERMTVPCRPASCTHLQCFDAHKFLLLNELKDYFICPICHKSITFEELQIDSVFCEIISRVPKTCTEVEFYEDGRWSTGKNCKNGLKRSIEVVDIAESEDDDDCILSASSPEKKFCGGPAAKSVVNKVSLVNQTSIPSLIGKASMSAYSITHLPLHSSSTNKSFLKTKEPLSLSSQTSDSSLPILVQSSESTSHPLKISQKSKQDTVTPSSHTESEHHLLSSSRTKKRKECISRHLEQPFVSLAAQQSPIDYSLPPKPPTVIPPKLLVVDRIDKDSVQSTQTINNVSQNFSIDRVALPHVLPKMPVDNQNFLPKMVAMDLTVPSKTSRVGIIAPPNSNILNLSINSKHSADVKVPKTNLHPAKFQEMFATKHHPKYVTTDAMYHEVPKTQLLPTRYKKVTPGKQHPKYASTNVKVVKTTPSTTHTYFNTNGSEQESNKMSGPVSLASPLHQHSGLVPALHHYAPMSTLPAIPSLVQSGSVGFASTKMFLPTKSEAACLYPPFMQARCPAHVPFYPYNVQYYNQNPYGRLDFGNVFGDRVQSLPNIYSFLPSAIFSQNLHDMNGDFLGQQAR